MTNLDCYFEDFTLKVELRKKQFTRLLAAGLGENLGEVVQHDAEKVQEEVVAACMEPVAPQSEQAGNGDVPHQGDAQNQEVQEEEEEEIEEEIEEEVDQMAMQIVAHNR